MIRVILAVALSSAFVGVGMYLAYCLVANNPTDDDLADEWADYVESIRERGLQ